MAQIEYCDNVNCILNHRHTCTAPEVDFDHTGSCITARYEGGDTPRKRGESAPADTENRPRSESRNDGDKWLKYI